MLILLLFYRCSGHKIHDLSFYDDNTFCVLLREETEDGFPILAQVPLNITEDTDDFVSIPDHSESVVNMNNM